MMDPPGFVLSSGVNESNFEAMAENKTGIDIDGFNRATLDWTRGTRKELIESMLKLGIGITGFSRRNLRARTRKSDGTIFSISYRFPRTLIYVQKGVGKGVPISRAGDPAINRKPKDWYNPVLSRRIDKLGAAIQPFYSDAIVNQMRALIN